MNDDTTIEQLQARITELEARNALLELQVAALTAKINELVPYVDYSRMQKQSAGYWPITGYKTAEWRGWNPEGGAE